MRAFNLMACLIAGAFALTAQKPQIRQVPVSRADPTSGAEMFRAYCAPCHGLDGRGNGPAAAALKKPPTDLTELALRNNGKYPELKVFNAIVGDTNITAHGSKEMPVWGEVLRSLSRDEAMAKMRISNLTRYVETLQKK